MFKVSDDSEKSLALTLLFPWQRLDLDVSQRERTPLTGHILLPSNRYKKSTNRNRLGD